MQLRPAVLLFLACRLFGQDPLPLFPIEEATISTVHDAMKAGRLTCESLVRTYLRRIDTYDKNGPAINAIILVNPDAIAQARAMDRLYTVSGLTGPLHCVPVIVKDNFETKGLQTTDGALAFKGYVPGEDAFQVRKMKEAGAIVLAKSNLAEWAFTPYETLSSILPGYTRNPYALDRVTAGSSGGTAAAVAANFGLVGLGSDTGNSIRGPSSHQSLVGIRSTMGLTSRAGVLPLSSLADVAGPMTRTLEDAVKVLQVIAGPDPKDPVTSVAAAHLPQNYAASLDRNGLKGAVIGILRQAYEREGTDPEVTRIFMTAVDDLRRAGATVVDPAPVDLAAVRRDRAVGSCMGFKYDMNAFLAARDGLVPMKNLAAIIQSGGFHPSSQRRLEMAEKDPENGPDSPACIADREYRAKFREAVLKAMEKYKLDAFVYPTWSNPPRLIGDLNTPAGDNSQIFSPTTGFPAITVPMGYTKGGTLPAGMTFFGRAWSEPALIRLVYGYEQATRHRRPPASAPPLR